MCAILQEHCRYCYKLIYLFIIIDFDNDNNKTYKCYAFINNTINKYIIKIVVLVIKSEICIQLHVCDLDCSIQYTCHAYLIFKQCLLFLFALIKLDWLLYQRW